MLQRIYAISLNTYREAVRARILHGLFGLAVLTLGYSLIVGAFSLGNQARAVADVGSASISVYSLIVAIVVTSTSLYRELELKTIFPILARPMHRGSYLLGKYFGTIVTIATFIMLNTGMLLLAEGVIARKAGGVGVGVPLGAILGLSLLAWKLPTFRSWVPIPLGLFLLGFGYFHARIAPIEAQLIVYQSLLTFLELLIVSAIALVFAAFSSPFLTALFTLGVVLIGRSADTLARLPERVFGEGIKQLGEWLSQVVPNLMVYVPPRSFLTGEKVGVELSAYFGLAALQSFGWSLALLVLAITIFKKRDFL